MLELPDNVNQVLKTLVPASIISEISCFVFYDDHPRDDKNIEIIVCTKHGEVNEYYRRDLISSIKLDSTNIPTEIRLLRNNNCELYYLLFAEDELFLLSRKDKISLHQNITNVERYDITDITCSGQPSLRVIKKDDAIPLIFDESLENFKSSMDISFSKRNNDESLPIINHLMRKLTEARYNLVCNEKTYRDMLNIHQAVGFAAYKKIYPNIDESVFNENPRELAGALKIESQPPFIKICNNMIVIIFHVCSENPEPLNDVHLLLHGTPALSMEYTTKLFESTPTPPFYVQTTTQTIRPHTNMAVVVVLTMEELKDSVTSRIEFNGVLFYKQGEKEFLLPVDDVVISTSAVMGEDFDALNCDNNDGNFMLAVLSTTEKTELVLRHIKQSGDEELSVETFIKYLHMEKVRNTDNLVVHRKSPYHILNGVMVLWHETQDSTCSYALSVYSRTPSQVLALLHFIHDAVPFRIVITTPNYKLTAKVDDLTKFNEDLLAETQVSPNYNSYASSMLNRTNLVLEYLDNSMIKMSETKNPVIQSKIGSEIDLFASDVGYLKFKSKMRVEAVKGVEALNNDLVKQSDSDDIMFID